MFIVDICKKRKEKISMFIYITNVFIEIPGTCTMQKGIFIPFANATFRSDKCVIGGHHF